MDFMSGAIIGGAVGLAAAIVAMARRQKQRGQVLSTLEGQGAAAAQAVLDQEIPPVDKIPLTKLIDQRERMAGLALIGNVDALEREIAAHTGAVTAVAQVNSIAMLGIAVRGDSAVGADMLARLADWTDAEGGRAIALVKKKVRALAVLAAGIAGQPVPDDAWHDIDAFTKEGGMVQVLTLRAIAMAMRRAGREADAARFDARVREHTPIFDGS